MDFESMNPLNVRINIISGNLLPLTSNGSQFPITLKIYSAFVWMFEIILMIVIIPGCMYVSTEKILKDGMICFAVLIEMVFVVVQIHVNTNPVRQIIRKLNDMLRANDEIMKNVITTTLKPIMTPLKFYLIAGSTSVAMWYCASSLLVFKRNFFYYEDYRHPIAFSRQPFSLRIFFLGTLFLLISCLYMFIKKVGVDIYIIYLILMVTAQYRYISLKITMLFQDGKPQNVFDKSNQKRYPGRNQRVETELKALCQHYNAVILLSSMLKKVLALSCSVIYADSILRFCCIGLLLSTIISSISLEGIVVIMYASGSVVQFYILCLCVQQLLDASKEMTDKAFNERWYDYSLSVKRIFILLIQGNNLECKLSVCDMFNLSLSSFMTILNQSYTVALLCSKIK